MKKLLLFVALVIGLGTFFYYYFSAPRVIERRLDGLLDSMTFGAVSFQEKSAAAAEFTDYFTDPVLFSGAGNELITGSPSREEMASLYQDQLRAAAKSAQAFVSGETSVNLLGSDQAVMQTVITLEVTTFANTRAEQEIPCRLVWKKSDGDWRISEVQLRTPLKSGF